MVLIIGGQPFILSLLKTDQTKSVATLSISSIISGSMRIPNWNKCHRANEDCPEIPRSCGQHDVSTIAAEKTHRTSHWKSTKQKKRKTRKMKKRKTGGKRKTEGGRKKGKD